MSWDWLRSLPVWPDRISAHAGEVDAILVGFGLVLLLFTVPVFVAMTWFAIRYRRGSSAPRTGRPRGSPWIETAWAAIPLAIASYFFVQAAEAYFALHVDVKGALQIDVVAKQWMWKSRHPSGRRQINRINVPVDTPVRLNMISQDVIHSLYFPALRIKQDLLPGRYTRLRFTADRTGTFHLACAEFCGTQHSRMRGSLVVMEKEEYEAWAASGDTFAPPELAGERLFRDKGCAVCHGGDGGGRDRGPDLAGLYGSTVALADGGSVRADETYLRTAMVRPNRQVVAGYRPIMPSYENVLAEEDIRALIAYIRVQSDRAEEGR